MMSYKIGPLAFAALAKLQADPDAPLSAAEVGTAIGTSSREASFPLRALEQAGLAIRRPLTPASTRLVWSPTATGRTHPIDLTGLDDELRLLEARRRLRPDRS